VTLLMLPLFVAGACSDEAPAGRGGGGLVLAMEAGDPGALWELADFELTERGGELLGRDELRGAPWVASFVFTRCAGPCPRITADMAWLQGRLADTEARLVSITVDPRFDTPAVLDRYAERYGADPKRWLFLTGDQLDVYRVVKEVFLQPLDIAAGGNGTREPTHSTRFVVVDAGGRVRGVYDSEDRKGRRAALERLLFLSQEGAE